LSQEINFEGEIPDHLLLESDDVVEVEKAYLERAEDDSTDDESGVVDGSIYLGSVRELFEDYIGIPIVGYITFKDGTLDLEKKVITKIITSVKIDGSVVVLTLSKPDATYGGYVKLSPVANGQFSEIKSDEESTPASHYRISFYGGDSIEYQDKNRVGQIYYSSGRYNKS
jgi:hypothetical protein